jgi:hypothetical protein
VLGALVAFLAGSHLLWAAGDLRPPVADQAIHLENALACGRLVARGAWTATLELSAYYPPLVHCAAGLLHLLLGPSRLVALLATQAALLLVVFGTAAIGTRLGSPAAGVAAALLVGGYPEIFLESRAFMLDVPLTALVTVTVLALLRSEGFTRPGWILLTGCFIGLGLLTKWTYFLFLPPAVLAVGLGERRPPGRPVHWRALLGALAIAALLAAPWYLRHPGLPASLLKNAFAVGVAEGDPGLGTLAGWLFYVGGLRTQLGVPALGLLAAAAIVLGCSPGTRPRALPVLLAWIVGPLLFLTLLRNKDLRYTMPLLPAIAVVTAVPLIRVVGRHARVAVTVAAGALVAHTAFLGGGWPAPTWARGRMDRTLLFPSFPPLAEAWPTRLILDRIVRDRAGGPRPVTVSVVPDHPSFSRFTFSYESAVARLGVRAVKAPPGPPSFVDYLVTKTGTLGPEHTTGAARALMDRLAARDPTLWSLLAPVGAWPLPDGSRATLFRVDPSPLAEATAHQIEARLRDLAPTALRDYLHDVEGLQITVTPSSPAETARGRFRMLALRVDAARVGDFRRKPAGIRIRDAAVSLEDVRLNLHALLGRGHVELLGARRLRIEHGVVTDDALAQGLSELVPAATDTRLQARGGVLHVAGQVAGLLLSLQARPELESTHPLIVAIRVQAVRVGPVSIPDWLTRLALMFVNPVARFDSTPVQVEAARLEVADGRLRLWTP